MNVFRNSGRQRLWNLLALLLLLGIHSQIFAQGGGNFSSQGREFDFVFLQNRIQTSTGYPTNRNLSAGEDPNDPNSDRPVETAFYIANNAANPPANVRITFNGPPIDFTVNGIFQTVTANTLNLTVQSGTSTRISPAPRANLSSNNCANGPYEDSRDVQLIDNGLVQDKMFSITSSQDISVFTENGQTFSRDASLILPRAALGNKYIAITDDPDFGRDGANCGDGSGNYGGPAEIGILAVENNTQVTITVPARISNLFTSSFTANGPSPGVSLTTNVQTITLNRGEGLQLLNDGESLSGVIIESSNHPIAVFSGNMAASIGSPASGTQTNGWSLIETFDHITSQLLPVKSWGCHYGVSPITDNPEYELVILSETPNQISFQGFSQNIGPGDILRFTRGRIFLNRGRIPGRITNTPGIISGTAPFVVAQLGLSQNTVLNNDELDPFLLLLSPLNQGINRTAFSVLPEIVDSRQGLNNPRNTFCTSKRDFLKIFVNWSERNHLFLQENQLAARPIQSLPGFPGFTRLQNTPQNIDIAYTEIPVHNNAGTPVTYQLFSNRSPSQGFNAYIYGLDCREGYGYAAGLNVTPIAVSETQVSVCTGEPVQLGATGGGDYLWTVSSQPSGSNISLSGANSANPSFTPIVPGTYLINVTITPSGGCQTTDQVEVIVETCCTAKIDSSFETKFLSSQQINGDVFWDGKVYVDDGVILSVTGTLDITNVDVVFGQCAGIEVTSTGHIRANNSVFRTCIDDQTWKGISIDNAVNQKFNECTFKNAQIALQFSGDASGIVSNNLFYNCQTGLELSGVTQFSQPVSGNRFVADELRPNYNDCRNIIPNMEMMGISMMASNPSGTVTHNQFVNSIQNGSVNFVGIKMDRASATISENSFSNVFRSIEAVSSLTDPIRVENNEVEITQDISVHDNQFAFMGPETPLFIYGNELRNSSTNTFGPGTKTGIYIEDGFESNVNIQANEIHGFEIGMRLYDLANSQVTENTVLNSLMIGIYTERMDNCQISCNTIDMDHYSVTGLVLIHPVPGRGATEQNVIHSNCILDASTGIYVESLLGGGLEEIPVIRNNFLYNYSEAGIFNIGFTGNIGSLTVPGQNTFYSNNNQAVDLSSNTTISAANNFGMFNITPGVVQILQNNPYHSTASCGGQIFGQPSQGNLDPNLICDNFSKVTGPVTLEGDVFRLSSGTLQMIERFVKASPNRAYSVLGALMANENREADTWISLVEPYLSDKRAGWLQYFRALHQQDYASAKSILNNLEDFSGLNGSRKELDLEYLSWQLREESQTDSLEVPASLKRIANSPGPLRNHARRLLSQMGAPYKLDFLPVRSLKTPNPEFITVEENGFTMEVFPNPTTDYLNIRIHSDESVFPTLRIYDVTGKVLLQENAGFETGEQKVFVGNLSQGMYFLELITPERRLGKPFVKQ